MAGLLALGNVGLGVLIAPPALNLVGLDEHGLDSDLIWLVFDFEALAFFAERLGLGLEVFTKEPNLDFSFFALLLPSTLGDGCVSSVSCD